jgi:hypothetical protein
MHERRLNLSKASGGARLLMDEKNGWPVGPYWFLGKFVYQGVALAWENCRAFGPLIGDGAGIYEWNRDGAVVVICFNCVVTSMHRTKRAFIE